MRYHKGAAKRANATGIERASVLGAAAGNRRGIQISPGHNDNAFMVWFWKDNFDVASIPDLSGKVAIVTGGTAGLGLASAIELAHKGAHVIIGARNPERGEEAINSIRDALQKRNNKEFVAKIEYGIAEHEDLASMQSFVEWFLAKKLPLHILLLNAGVAFVPYRLIEGVESTLFINHVSHHYLTQLLLAKLKDSAPSRVVVVSSEAFRFVSSVNLDPPTPESHSRPKSYGSSKLANILFTRALQRRVENDGIIANAIHPGTVRTHIIDKARGWSWIKAIVGFVLRWFGSTPAHGALTQLYAATSPDIAARGLRGQYFVPVAKHVPRLPASATDDAAAERLWEWTEATIRSVTARRPAAGTKGV